MSKKEEYRYRTGFPEPIGVLGTPREEIIIISEKPLDDLMGITEAWSKAKSTEDMKRFAIRGTVSNPLKLVLVGFETVRKYRFLPFFKKRMPVFRAILGE